MKKILVMPFLNIPSGHHQVADAVMEWIQYVDSSVEYDKVDIIEYSYGRLVSVISAGYVHFIRLFPKAYSYMYRKLFYSPDSEEKRFRMYEWLFMNDMKKLLEEKQPDCIICTHALPSYLANRMKISGLLTTPVINVYTDLFVNDIWGIQGIDYHLVPNLHIKEWLQQKGVLETRIFVTGIPTHPQITRSKKRLLHSNSAIHVLVAGGSLGIGGMRSFLKRNSVTENVHYFVLCGKNIRLYQELLKLNQSQITPLPYIYSREEMNRLYDEVDIIVTKAGGVTISEGLMKRIPILVYDTLPGQEEINLQYLKHMGLIFDLQDWNQTKTVEDTIIAILKSKHQLEEVLEKMEEYERQISDNNLPYIFNRILQTQVHAGMAENM
ncbi:UDP-glucuronosyltransferase [Fodinisporobacter ferrooxydans]|uniref:UDP-glucuronosyltransferase n=1 Tax=Fodinisporobacter ferrooxydans TaxID=2901836 RepID=A0ABY4CNG2_9BACL|nr:UDP-glucuronosyltransferase [Alicyclobacillaceae bacterium MYW30-H2]